MTAPIDFAALAKEQRERAAEYERFAQEERDGENRSSLIDCYANEARARTANATALERAARIEAALREWVTASDELDALLDAPNLASTVGAASQRCMRALDAAREALRNG